MVKRLVLLLILSLFFLKASNSVVLAKGYSYKAPKSYSVKSYTVPRINSNPRYIVPRNQIPVLKTQAVRSYVKKNGTVVPSYQRAQAGSLKPYYNPTYNKQK